MASTDGRKTADGQRKGPRSRLTGTRMSHLNSSGRPKTSMGNSFSGGNAISQNFASGTTITKGNRPQLGASGTQAINLRIKNDWLNASGYEEQSAYTEPQNSRAQKKHLRRPNSSYKNLPGGTTPYGSGGSAMKMEESRFLPTVTDDKNDFMRQLFLNNYTESTRTSQFDTVAKRPVSLQSKETSLANLAMMRNMEQLQKASSNLYSQKDSKEATNGLQLCDQLKILSDKVKATQVQLNQLVCGANQCISVLPEHPTTVEVVSMNTQTIRVETKDHKGPLALTVIYGAKTHVQDLVVSVHTIPKVAMDNKIWQFKAREKKPMAMRPWRAFDETLMTGKQSKDDFDKSQWQPDAIYAQFFSQEGCSFSVTANFIEEEAMRENRKNLKGNFKSSKQIRGKFYELVDKRIAEAVNKQAEIRRVNKEIKGYKKARRIREKANIETDFMAQNVDKTELWDIERMENIKKLKELRRGRMEQAKETREQNDANTFRFNLLSLDKWDFLKQKRREFQSQMDDRLVQRKQLTLVLHHAFKDQYIRVIYERFSEAVKKEKFRQLEETCASRLQKNYKIAMQRFGQSVDHRNMSIARDFIILETVTSRELQIQRAMKKMVKFLVAKTARKGLQERMQALPGFVTKWARKGIQVRQMLATKRAFLAQIFERELNIMLKHYQGKKKLKKLLTKLQSIKGHNLQKIIDDYFFKVCYEFYKRQMHIWILLRHKYHRNASVDISDRRFLYNDLGQQQEQLQEKIDSQSSAKDVVSDVNSQGGDVRITTEKAVVVDKYPVWFSEAESEPILEMSSEIKTKLEFLVRGTTESSAVGDLTQNINVPDFIASKTISYKRNENDEDDEEEQKKAPGRVNHYKEMKLEHTSILKRIGNSVGLQIAKKSKITPKNAAKQKKTQKKKDSLTMAGDLNASGQKQVCIMESIPEPIFRYVPDRDTIQRLLIRCSNMKDDLGEFTLFDEDGKGEQEQEHETLTPEQE